MTAKEYLMEIQRCKRAMQTLGITDTDCGKCDLHGAMGCSKKGRFVDACMAIEHAPTIEERKKGKWLYTDAYPHWMYCDRCYKRIVPNKEWIELYNIPTNYCPHCGADLRGENDGE